MIRKRPYKRTYLPHYRWMRYTNGVELRIPWDPNGVGSIATDPGDDSDITFRLEDGHTHHATSIRDVIDDILNMPGWESRNTITLHHFNKAPGNPFKFMPTWRRTNDRSD